MAPETPPPISAIPAEFHSRQARLARRLGLSLTVALAMCVGCTATLVTQPLVWEGTGVGHPNVSRPAELERHVRVLAETCVPRDWSHLENLERAADHITMALRSTGGRVSDQALLVRGISFRNVLASYGPEGGSRIVVGAHYDAYGSMPGADDNASGVAGLLELGRLLGQRPPPCRVDLVAYTLEEPPFFRTKEMGSAWHARHLQSEQASILGVIVLEMIGRYSNAPGSQRYPSVLMKPFYPSQGNFAAVVGRFGDIRLTRRVKASMKAATPLPVRSINGPRWIPGLDFSDHHPYWDLGFSAVMITDTAFYRNADYHTDGDTPDRLDYLRMAQLVEGVHAAIQDLGKQAH